jgi:hypothetical protein
MDSKKTNIPVRGKNGKGFYVATEARLKVFLDHYSKHGRVLQACEASGINFKTHYRHLQSDPEYRLAVEEAEQQAAQAVEDRVYDMALDNDLQASLVILRRFRPSLYRDRASIDVTADISISEALSAARQRVITIESNERTGTEGR